MKTQDNAEREAFEAWFKTEYGLEYPEDLEHYEPAPNRYNNDETDMMWLAWQAALSHTPAKPVMTEGNCRMSFPAMLDFAKAHVNGSPLFKKFIRATPLENDIAVWMVEFAQKIAKHSHSIVTGSAYDYCEHCGEMETVCYPSTAGAIGQEWEPTLQEFLTYCHKHDIKISMVPTPPVKGAL